MLPSSDPGFCFLRGGFWEDSKHTGDLGGSLLKLPPKETDEGVVTISTDSG